MGDYKSIKMFFVVIVCGCLVYAESTIAMRALHAAYATAFGPQHDAADSDEEAKEPERKKKVYDPESDYEFLRLFNAMRTHRAGLGYEPLLIMGLDGYNKMFFNPTDMNVTDEDGDTALILTVRHDHTETVKALLNDRGSAAKEACGSSARSVICALKEQKRMSAKKFARSEKERAACAQAGVDGAQAVSAGAQAIVRVDINAENNVGLTALHIAVMNGNYKIAAELLKYGVEVNAVDGKGNTPLCMALYYPRYRTCKNHISGKQIPFCPDNCPYIYGKSRLQLCDYIDNADGYVKMLKLLLAHGANTEIANIKKRTPLLLAIWEGNSVAVKTLIEGGADTRLVQINRAVIAKRKGRIGYDEVIKQLLLCGVDLGLRV